MTPPKIATIIDNSQLQALVLVDQQLAAPAALLAAYVNNPGYPKTSESPAE